MLATVVIFCALLTFSSSRAVPLMDDFVQGLLGRESNKSDPPVFVSEDDPAEALDLDNLFETSYLTMIDFVKQVNSGIKSATGVILTGKRMAEDMVDTIESSGEIATSLGSDFAMKDLLDSFISSSDVSPKRQMKGHKKFKSPSSALKDDFY